jgi:metal-responsive CopG/Arc/MetJ family transcriptional regulator
MRKTSRKTPTTTICVTLDDNLLEVVDALAAQQERSRGGMVRWLALRTLERMRQAERESAPTTTEPTSASA